MFNFINDLSILIIFLAQVFSVIKLGVNTYKKLEMLENSIALINARLDIIQQTENILHKELQDSLLQLNKDIAYLQGKLNIGP